MKKQKAKAVVVFSGGQDSTTCLFWALEIGLEVKAVTFDYNQRHNRELEAAAKIASIAGVEHEIIKLGPVLKGTSPLVSNNKLEQYASHQELPGGLEKTFVPMRNQLFLTLAANRAYVYGATSLVTGVCEEDYGGYPDCRSSFISAFEEACNRGTFTGDPDTLPNLKVLTPLMSLSKAKTVSLSIGLKNCYYALSFSHTGYDGAYPPTGKDHATLLRAKGFEEANVPDPLILRAHSEGLMDLPSTPNYNAATIRPYQSLLEKTEAKLNAL